MVLTIGFSRDARETPVVATVLAIRDRPPEVLTSVARDDMVDLAAGATSSTGERRALWKVNVRYGQRNAFIVSHKTDAYDTLAHRVSLPFEGSVRHTWPR
jgi:hypothetical protein